MLWYKLGKGQDLAFLPPNLPPWPPTFHGILILVIMLQ